jgi:sulfate permease, SulP family
LAEVTPEVRAELDRYGLTEQIGPDAFFETVSAMIDAFRAGTAESG